MKKLLVLTSAIISLGIFCASSCKKQEDLLSCENFTSKGRIIGFHPCRGSTTPNEVKGKGFVIAIEKETYIDTVVTYDIPNGLFEFLPSDIENPIGNFLFRPEIQNKFKIKFNYRVALDNEKTAVLCHGMSGPYNYYAAVKGKEIFITCISPQ